MKRLFATTMLVSILAAPAVFAQDNAGAPIAQDNTTAPEDLICSEFIALDATAQTEALNAMHEALAEGADAAEDTAADAGSPADGAAAEPAEDPVASDTATADGRTADVTAEAVAEVCDENPDLTIQEAADQA